MQFRKKRQYKSIDSPERLKIAVVWTVEKLIERRALTASRLLLWRCERRACALVCVSVHQSSGP